MDCNCTKIVMEQFFSPFSRGTITAPISLLSQAPPRIFDRHAQHQYAAPLPLSRMSASKNARMNVHNIEFGITVDNTSKLRLRYSYNCEWLWWLYIKQSGHQVGVATILEVPGVDDAYLTPPSAWKYPWWTRSPPFFGKCHFWRECDFHRHGNFCNIGGCATTSGTSKRMSSWYRNRTAEAVI